MAKDPAVLFYPSDFLSGVFLMDYDTRGRYITLLMLQHEKGSIKENDFLKISGEKFEEISEKFERDSSGNYYNKRMRKESNRRKKYTESRRSNRSSGSQNKKHMSNICETHDNTYDESYVEHMGNGNRNGNGNGNRNKKEKEGNEKVREMTEAVIEKLNHTCGSRYKATSEKTRSLVRARMEDGFTLSDFETVIEKKAAEWTGTEYEKYLRPETLFGTKFEGYLNQNQTQKNKNKFLELVGSYDDE